MCANVFVSQSEWCRFIHSTVDSHAPAEIPVISVIKEKIKQNLKHTRAIQSTIEGERDTRIQFYLFSTLLILASQCQTNNSTAKQTADHYTNLHAHSIAIAIGL